MVPMIFCSNVSFWFQLFFVDPTFFCSNDLFLLHSFFGSNDCLLRTFFVGSNRFSKVAMKESLLEKYNQEKAAEKPPPVAEETDPDLQNIGEDAEEEEREDDPPEEEHDVS